MKLYYSPGACSLAPQIVLQELGLTYESERVDLKTHKTESGKDFYTVNPKGYVPTLVLDNGDVLTEGSAMLLYLAGLKPEKKLAVAPGDTRYFNQLEWLIFISTEIHKPMGGIGFTPFDPATKDIMRGKLATRLAYINTQLGKTEYLLGKDFNVADAYLFTILRWAGAAQVDLTPYANITAFNARVRARKAVMAAMEKEGLAPAKAA